MIILEIMAYIVGFVIGSSLFFYFLDKIEEKKKKKENWQRKYLYSTSKNPRRKRNEIGD